MLVSRLTSCSKDKGVRERFEAAGAELLYPDIVQVEHGSEPKHSHSSLPAPVVPQ
jgi:hypothetical protein